MTTTDQTTAGPLIDWEPGTTYPVRMVARLADGQTVQTPQWIAVWEYQPTSTLAARMTITLMVPDKDGHLTTSGPAMDASYQDGEWRVGAALRLVSDPQRDRTMYEPRDPASNSAEILAETYRRDLGQRRLTAAEAARRVGIAPSTMRAYVARGTAPQPDGRIDARTPYWLASTIDAWRPTE